MSNAGDGATPTIALDAAGDVELRVQDVLTGRAFITGKSGSGKSSTMNVVAEELLAQGYPLLIVDIEGEYWGLKEEYELLRVGADEECDLQVAPEHGEWIAERALEDEIPTILDLSGYFDEAEARELVENVARNLFHLENQLQKPFLLVVEEAHEYLPQQGSLDGAGRVLRKIGKRGRKRGLGLAALSQRPADVDKSYITQCDWMLWHRLTWENDLKVVKRVLGSEYRDTIGDLGDGEAYLRADWLDETVRVQMRRQETFDAGATPTLDGYDRPDLKDVTDSLGSELEEISERATRRQNRVEQLEAELEQKDDRIAELEDRVQRLLDLREMVESADGIDAAGGSPESVTVEIEGESLALPEIRAEVMEVREEKADLEQQLAEVREERDRLRERVEDLEQRPSDDDLVAAVRELGEWFDRHDEALASVDALPGMDVEAAVGDRIAALRERLAERDARIEELEAQASGGGRDGAAWVETADALELIEHEAVESEVERVAGRSDYRRAHFDDALRALAMNPDEDLTANDVAPFVDASVDTARSVLNDLHRTGFVRWDKSKPYTYCLAVEDLRSRVEHHEHGRQRDRGDGPAGREGGKP